MIDHPAVNLHAPECVVSRRPADHATPSKHYSGLFFAALLAIATAIAITISPASIFAVLPHPTVPRQEYYDVLSLHQALASTLTSILLVHVIPFL